MNDAHLQLHSVRGASVPVKATWRLGYGQARTTTSLLQGPGRYQGRLWRLGSLSHFVMPHNKSVVPGTWPAPVILRDQVKAERRLYNLLFSGGNYTGRLSQSASRRPHFGPPTCYDTM